MMPPALVSGWPLLLALLGAALVLFLHRRDDGWVYALVPLVMLLPLAATVLGTVGGDPSWSALMVGLTVAILSRDRDDLLQSECALKLLWVMGAAIALSWAGSALLTVATGTSRGFEQWSVLAMGIEPRDLWAVALPLSLLAGMVLLGGAPFHFWVADLFQGARPWITPIAVAALQACGAAWLVHGLEGVAALPDSAAVARGLLGAAAVIAFLAGAATLLVQRRPERRVGSLASLNGALILGALAAHPSAPRGALVAAGLLASGPHLALALTGAGLLARFVHVPAGPADVGPVLFRRHPVTGALGLVALLSLAGVPGTPGARLWLEVARALAHAGRTGVLLALAVAWLAAFATALQQCREAFGIPGRTPPPEGAVPWPARAALWASGLGTLALGVAWWAR